MQPEPPKPPVLPVPQTVAELANLLNGVLTTTDNFYRRSVENCVASTLNSVNLPMQGQFYVQILNQPAYGPGIRQLAAVLLRKKILTFWRIVGVQEGEGLKNLLLQILANEQVKLVRLAVAHIICVLGKTELQEGRWPALTQAIASAIQSPAVEHREIALAMVLSLASVANHSPEFIQAGGTATLIGLKDPVTEIRMAALTTVGEFLRHLGASDTSASVTALIKELVPLTLEVVKEHVASLESVPLVMRTLEVLEQMVDMYRDKNQDGLMQIINFMGATVGSKDAHLCVRHAAIDILNMIVESRPRFVYKKQLIGNFVDLSMQLMAEDETILRDTKFYEEGMEDLADDELSMVDVHPPATIGSSLLECLSDNIPAKHLMSHVMKYATAVSTNPQSVPPLSRKAAILAVGVCSKGCAAYLRKHLSAVMQLTQTLVGDPVPCVREAAVYSLGRYCAWLQPDIILHHATAMPLLLNQLGDPNDVVRSRLGEAISVFAEALGDEIDQYVPQLVPKLCEILSSSSLTTQESICSALTAIAIPKPPSLKSFAPMLFGMFQEPLGLTDPSTVLLRAATFEAVGVLATASGLELFSPFFEFYTGKCMEGIQKGQRAELREYCFGFLASIAELMKTDFAPYLPRVIPCILDVLEDDENERFSSRNPLMQADMRIGDDDIDGEGLGACEDEEADLVEDFHGRIRNAELQERSSCLYCIGVLAKTQREALLPYADELYSVLELYCSHHAERCQENAIIALTKLLCVYVGPEPFPKEIGYPQAETLSQQLRDKVNEHVMSNILQVISQHTSKAVCASAFEALQGLLEEFGAVAPHQFMDEIIEQISQYFKGIASCQETLDDEEEEAMEGSHDNEVIDTVCDTLEELCKAYGPSFAPFFNKVATDLVGFIKPEAATEDIVMATGCLGVCLDNLGIAASPYFEQSIKLATELIQTTDDTVVKGNCCYIIRALSKNLPQAITAQNVGALLQTLWGVVAAEEEIPQARDNAIAAACSLVIVGSQALGPDNTKMVMSTILGYLPMRIDKEENIIAVECVCFVMEQFPPLCTELMQPLVTCLGRMMSSSTVTNDLKDKLASSAQRTIVNNQRQLVSEVMAQLPNRMQNAMKSRLF